LWVSNIALGNTYYEDIHNCVSNADSLMANPPFNVDEVDKEKIKNNKRRFPFGMPRGNANYLWIQLFYSALTETGRAGFVMANSAGDAELEIRQQLIKTGVVDVMIAVSSNMFYTVTLPCTLWFFDKGKVKTPRKDKVLFIDARNLYGQISRKLREFKSGCIEKEAIAERFPALGTVEGLLVESPIDDDFWDWNEELQQAEQVKALIEPVVKPMQEEADKLVSALYALEVYENVAKPLLGTPLLGNKPENVQQAIRALVRAEALAKVEDKDGQPTLDLENERKVKAIHRKAAKLQLDLEEIEEEDKREGWLKQQTERFNLSAQKKLVEILLSRNLLLDCQRVALPLDDGDIEGSLGQIYAEDVEQAVKLWQDTHGTNHVKIIRDIVRAYREKDGEIEPVAGLYKVATLAEIEEKGWSSNPGRYVGVAEREADDYEFAERLEELNEELEILNAQARDLEERIAENVVMLLEEVGN
jgi:type I restriction-modification system DNA methylase subunit